MTGPQIMHAYCHNYCSVMGSSRNCRICSVGDLRNTFKDIHVEWMKIDCVIPVSPAGPIALPALDKVW